ncbi:MAG: hypothetical protein Cons2KO_17010 [Congregibacter sp.]
MLCTSSAGTLAELQWHWEDSFRDDEKNKLQLWLREASQGVEAFAGAFPFDVHVHLHRRDGASQPVPWANTERSGRQAIHFYVDAQYGLQAFREDWTAAHEFSHLIIPYVGRSNAWFAEGFASYLQHSVMVEIGVIDHAEALRRRDQKMSKAVKKLAAAAEPLPDTMPELRKQGAYPTFYWGGAVYFERVDAALLLSGTSLRQVLQDYLHCCRQGRRSLDGLAALLDGLSPVSAFSDELRIMRSTAGVPERPQFVRRHVHRDRQDDSKANTRAGS